MFCKGIKRIALGAVGVDDLDVFCCQKIFELEIGLNEFEGILGIQIWFCDHLQTEVSQFFFIVATGAGEDDDTVPVVLEQLCNHCRIGGFGVPPMNVAANQDIHFELK